MSWTLAALLAAAAALAAMSLAATIRAARAAPPAGQSPADRVRAFAADLGFPLILVMTALHIAGPAPDAPGLGSASPLLLVLLLVAAAALVYALAMGSTGSSTRRGAPARYWLETLLLAILAAAALQRLVLGTVH